MSKFSSVSTQCVIVKGKISFPTTKFSYLFLNKLTFSNMSLTNKTKDIKPEPVAYSESALRNNAVVVEYCRTSMAALSGSTAGILGLTGLNGFAFYVFSVVVLWMMFMIKAGPNWSKYYITRQGLLTSGFFGALFTYILFWTFIYGMVHVY